MMKPQVEPARRRDSIALVVVVSALAGAGAGAGVTMALNAQTCRGYQAVEPAPTPRPPISRIEVTSIPSRYEDGAMVVRRADNDRQIDLMSPTEFGPDGSVDDVYELSIDAPTPIRHIFITRDEQGLQWDTVAGNEVIPFGGFTGREGAWTWHVGVRENGQWLNSGDGSLHGALGAGKHTLELVATAPQGTGRRTIAVMFFDGTTKTVELR